MKSTATRFARFYLVALVVALLLGNVDYELAKQTGHTWLSIPAVSYLDGGSRESLGFGYTLTCRHKIDHREDDRNSYLVGPELKAWNVFQIFGARKLFDRDYGELVYYRDKERTDRVIQGSIAGDMLGQKIFMAVIDVLPLAVLVGLFTFWTKYIKPGRVRSVDRSGSAR